MVHKRLLRPERLRAVPSQFSWLDHYPYSGTQIFQRLGDNGYTDRKRRQPS